MSENKAILILDPKSELHFKGPFTEVVTSTLKLSNASERRICFKVKTTAPKRYCVRPNNGIVEPKSTATIAVMLQPFDIEQQSDRNKHKFMVQTMFVPDGDVNQDQLWKEATPDQITDSKLKCVFDIVPNSSLNNSKIQESETTTSNSTINAPNTSWPNIGNSPNVTASNASLESASSKVVVSPLQEQSSESTNRGRNVSSTNNTSTTPASRPLAAKGESGVPSGISGDSSSKKGAIGSENEFRSLREEVSRLRSENMHLKEQELRNRIRGQGQSSSSSPSSDLRRHSSQLGAKSGSSSNLAGQEVVQLLVNPNVLAIGLVFLVIGILLGKVVF